MLLVKKPTATKKRKGFGSTHPGITDFSEKSKAPQLFS